MRRSWRWVLAAAGVSAAAVSAGVAATAGTGSRSAGDITIGASLPQTGPLAPFGPTLSMGYQRAVGEVNAAGGLKLSDGSHKVKLVILDNKSDPNTASSQARTLYLQNGAVAMLGSITPPLGIPLSKVAEQIHRPFVTTTTPVRAWLSGGPYKWSWDFFFDELQMTQRQFQASSLVKTNKKVVLFTDTEEDGIVMGKLWTANAPKFGYTIVAHESFPVGTTDFSKYIADAKSKGAQVLIAQMIPPDAIALWKQMKAGGFQPETAFCEKCSNNGAWGKALGKLANGTSEAEWWVPEAGFPQSAAFLAIAKKLGGRSSDVSVVVAAYSAARILFDAIERAGSTDPAKINAAIAKTNKTYPLGPAKFAADHHAATPIYATQWQNGQTYLVYPRLKGAHKLLAPVPGLR
jgi:branched-chain amino acid transport system substrate-binding protein